MAQIKSCSLRFRLRRIEPQSFHPILRAKIGTQAVDLVIDTGASKSCFDINTMKRIQKNLIEISNEGDVKAGIGSSDFEAASSVIKDFEVGALKLKRYPAVLLSLDHINAAYSDAGFKSVQGMLGCDFLKRFKAVIDFETRTMTLTWCE